jgi:hypothetical protein
VRFEIEGNTTLQDTRIEAGSASGYLRGDLLILRFNTAKINGKSSFMGIV